ncbi:MAG TPA: hypothetical protein VFX50_00525 [Gemmatimonadales bacterium]|nr:hypothetical protein [Gemmatimonadales bacterium]
MRQLRQIFTAAAVAAVVTAAPAAAQGLVVGELPLTARGAVHIQPFLSLAIPTGDLADASSIGYGLGGQVSYGMGAFSLVGELGFVTFNGETVDTELGEIEFEDESVVNISGGVRLPLGPVYIGGLAGWYSDDIDFDLVPVAGLHLGPIDLGVRYNGLVADADWVQITGGIHLRLN